MFLKTYCFVIFIICSFPFVLLNNDFAEFEDPDDVSSDQFFSTNKPQSELNSQLKKDKDIDSYPSKNKNDEASESSSNKANEQVPSDGSDLSQQNSENSPINDGSTLESPSHSQDEEAIVEAESDEMSQFSDNEEFEGFDVPDSNTKNLTHEPKPDIKIAKVPHHLITSWEKYIFEIIMLAGLVVYMLAFLVGKTKNQRLAEAWLSAHRDILDLNFSLVGDDGGNNPNSGQFNKEAEHLYNLWCSGRVCVEGMLVELKLLKRQDLVSVISNWFKPSYDQIIFTVRLEPAELEGFVMAIAQKRKVSSLIKDFTDLSFFCPDKKALPRSTIPDSFVMLSEIGEATMSILDTTVCKMLEDFEDQIEYIHVSDQFTGKKSTVEPDSPQITPEPKLEKVVIVAIRVGKKGNVNTSQIEATRPILKFVFYLIERVRKIKLSKEAKAKSEKNRRKALEMFQRQLHSQRQEAAQQRREEKRRVEKERLLTEEDPEKARKMEEKDNKKEAKRKQPKAKLLKVKGM